MPEKHWKLFLFPHQDDEYFAAPLLKEAPEQSFCLFLTRGDFYGSDPGQRNAESLFVLTKLGVPRENIVFVSDTLPIPDTALAQHLEAAYGTVMELAGHLDIAEVYTTAYEGGHPDHDAAALLAVAVAGQFQCRANQFFLYNAYGCSKPFFRVMEPLSYGSSSARSQSVTAMAALRLAFLYRHYRSQWKTWLGLGPFAVWKWLSRRSFHLQTLLPGPAELFLARADRPHNGPLYYEVRNWMQFGEFLEHTALFRKRYLSRPLLP